MTLKERSELYFGGDKTSLRNMPFCINCKHFCQHYVKDPVFITGESPLDGGHCMLFRRHRRYYFAYDTCEHFQSNIIDFQKAQKAKAASPCSQHQKAMQP